ncbi:MAG: hypothetical protein DRI95_05015 [Bacteroidetes bacterium]|nr:MAG: hypothetical protein DRI95_05015 [Bacteroidota bacterium]RLD74870.1 MAG: hypothetical protein DRJ07_19115 [Bacteroidota bacterium]
MLILDKEKAIDFYSLTCMYELHAIKEKIRLFEKKYGKNFEQFELALKKGKENFAKWDDFMQWKAYEKTHESLIRQKAQIKNGDYKIS